MNKNEANFFDHTSRVPFCFLLPTLIRFHLKTHFLIRFCLYNYPHWNAQKNADGNKLWDFLFIIFEWMNVYLHVYTAHITYVSWWFTILLSEIERQLVKAPLAAAISWYMISLTHPTHSWNVRWTRDRPPHRELRALLFSISVWVLYRPLLTM